MIKNYNYERKKLLLPEYGRHIHTMVDFLSTIEDREERNRQARAVISVMGNLNTLLRDTADFNHKLWDHLFIMSGFTLDVDSPYPIPTADTLAPIPNKLKYPDKKIAIKHYGKNIENIIKSLKECDDPTKMENAISSIAKYMRSKSYEYNQEYPNNEIIIKDIRRLSGNTISVSENTISEALSEHKQTGSQHQKKGGFQNSRQNRGKNSKNGQQGNKNSSAKQHRNRPK